MLCSKAPSPHQPRTEQMRSRYSVSQSSLVASTADYENGFRLRAAARFHAFFRKACPTAGSSCSADQLSAKKFQALPNSIAVGLEFTVMATALSASAA